jgi:hypothetical protein
LCLLLLSPLEEEPNENKIEKEYEEEGARKGTHVKFFS